MSELNALILNEDKIVTKLIKNALLDLDYDVQTSNDAIQALEIIKNGNIDLVVIDFVISYMTGYELVTQIRAIQSRYIKIIVLSKISLSNVVTEAFRLGVDDYLTIPVRIEEFRERTNRLNKYRVFNSKMTVVEPS